MQCLEHTMENTVTPCTELLLTKFFAAHPESKVLQVGYDVPCEVAGVKAAVQEAGGCVGGER